MGKGYSRHIKRKMTTTSERHVKTEPPLSNTMKLICWNIYGLDSNNLRERTVAICDVINSEKPEAVFLQEVILRTLWTLKHECPEYQVIPAAQENYFTAIMLRKEAVDLHEQTIHPFPQTRMSRKLQEVKCSVYGVKCQLMTSHLESMETNVEKRKKQLKISLDAMLSSDPNRTTIFGGDLNLRDREVTAVGGIPEGIVDLWAVAGRPRDAEYTWDYNQGTTGENHRADRFRFDRIYMRQNSSTKLVLTDFKLVGLERVLPCNAFPSDHWGIMTSFDIKH